MVSPWKPHYSPMSSHAIPSIPRVAHTGPAGHGCLGSSGLFAGHDLSVKRLMTISPNFDVWFFLGGKSNIKWKRIILKVSGNICPTMVVYMQKLKKFMCNTSRYIIRYFSTVTRKDYIYRKTRFHRRFQVVYIDTKQIYIYKSSVQRETSVEYHNLGSLHSKTSTFDSIQSQ